MFFRPKEDNNEGLLDGVDDKKYEKLFDMHGDIAFFLYFCQIDIEEAITASF